MKLHLYHASVLGWITSVLMAPILNRNINKFESKENQQKYLAQFGYIEKNNINRYSNLDDTQTFKDAISKLQRFARIKVTGEMNDETLEVMNRKRCHLPDFGVNFKSLSSRTKRYVLLGRFISTYLTWQVSHYPTRSLGLSNNEVTQIISKSFADWGNYAPLYFQQSFTYGPRLNISFLDGDHADGYPFDGPSGILAHAFFPEDGRLHFDNAESWSDGIDSGVNLRSVATHEIGHILGLGHSSVPNAVMQPYYTPYSPNFGLTSDDIQAIQLLYGKKNYLETTFRSVTSFAQNFIYTITTTTTITPAPVSPAAQLPWISVYTTPKYYTTVFYNLFTTPYFQFWNNGRK